MPWRQFSFTSVEIKATIFLFSQFKTQPPAVLLALDNSQQIRKLTQYFNFWISNRLKTCKTSFESHFFRVNQTLDKSQIQKLWGKNVAICWQMLTNVSLFDNRKGCVHRGRESGSMVGIEARKRLRGCHWLREAATTDWGHASATLRPHPQLRPPQASSQWDHETLLRPPRPARPPFAYSGPFPFVPRVSMQCLWVAFRFNFFRAFLSEYLWSTTTSSSNYHLDLLKWYE